MNIIHLTIGIGTVLILAGSLSRADAAQIPIKGTFSGSFVNTQIDTNNDGRKASLGTRGMKGTFGPATGQAMLEYASPSPGTCPNGQAGVILTLGSRPSVPVNPLRQQTRHFCELVHRMMVRPYSLPVCPVSVVRVNCEFVVAQTH